MSKLRGTVVAFLAAALIGGSLSACGGGASSGTSASGDQTQTKTVKLGFAAPLTGDNAIYGEGMLRAVRLAIKEANASDEFKKAGYQFEVNAQDDQGDPKQAVNVANMLVGDSGVSGVVGHFNSGCSIPASSVYQKAGLAMVSVSSNPQLTAHGLDVVNRVVAKDDTQGEYAAGLVKKLGFTKVAVIDDSTPYGEGLAAEFVKRFEADGGKVVRKDKIQAKEVDFSAVVTRIKAAGAEAIYYGGAHAEGGLISKQASEQGLDVPVIGGDMIFSKDYIEIAGATNAEGDICTSLGLPLEQQPRGAEFKASYKKEYNQDPQAYDSYAYDSAWIIMRAVLKAGTERGAVAKAIRSTPFDGVTGAGSFDANGDTSNKAISAYKVVKGEWQQIKE